MDINWMQTNVAIADTYYKPQTPPEVVKVLEACRASGRRIRIRYGWTRHPHTERVRIGLDWLDDHNVEGTVSRSSGRIKVPLLIHSARSTGGEPIMDNCIVRIIDTKTHQVLYSHPKYHHPKFTITPGTSFNGVEIRVGRGHALQCWRFKDERCAKRWVRKMSL